MKSLIELTKEIKNVNIAENKLILEEFENLVKINAKGMKDVLKKENDIYNANFQYDKLLESFNKLNGYNYDNLKQYSSIGTIVCITNGDTYFVLEMIIKAILTQSKLIFISDRYMLSSNNFFVDIAKNALEKYKVNKEAISVFDTTDYNVIGMCINNIDCIVVNKNYEVYKDLQELYDIKIIYSDYGNINIYSDSSEFNSLIESVCEDAKREDKQVFIAKTDDIEKYIANMNNNFLFHSVLIYTKNAAKCAYFIKNIKAENVYINMNPFNSNDISFNEYELIYKKKIMY